MEIDYRRNSPFMLACKYGRIQNVKLLIEDKMRYNYK